MKKNNAVKDAVIARIAGTKPRRQAFGRGLAKYDVGGEILHVRFCSSGTSTSHYKFNINPNTLSADYEVWICGNESHYYLIPIEHIRKMYEDPGAYTDNAHRNIRVVSVDSSHHISTYATGAKKIDLRKFFRTTL